jgi:hypothetical protein
MPNRPNLGLTLKFIVSSIYMLRVRSLRERLVGIYSVLVIPCCLYTRNPTCMNAPACHLSNTGSSCMFRNWKDARYCLVLGNISHHHAVKKAGKGCCLLKGELTEKQMQ